MARILSIDYGRKRTGIAVTDPAQIIPGGLTTVQTSQLMDFLKSYFEKEPVERVIIGLPKEMNGNLSENAQNIAVFLKHFAKTFPQMPIESYDERFTSVLAHRTMIDSGISRTARRNKALVDEISATIILQSYLDYTKNKKPLP